jgi:hypothetical protein
VRFRLRWTCFGGPPISFHPTKSGRVLMAPSLNADKNTPSSCDLAPALFFLEAAFREGHHPKAVDSRNLMIPSRICARVWLRRWFARASYPGSDHAARQRRRSLECLVDIARLGDISNHPGADREKFARIIVPGKRRDISGKQRRLFGLLQISTNNHGEEWVTVFR